MAIVATGANIKLLLQMLQNILGGAQRAGPIKGYPLRVDFASAPTYSERVMLVGEAAGLVNPVTRISRSS
jgi:flavin-dependent dehydrogenase